MDVEKTIEGIPESPGVYLMKDAQEHIAYIGKANNIRKRVLSHFRNTDNEKDSLLSSITTNVEFIVAPSEVEALLLENNLIKKHKPRYNIRLRDDKSYPFIKLSISEEFPQITLTRRIVDDGSLYFGPMGDVSGARTTMKIVRRIFPIRNCAREIHDGRKKERPCLEYQLRQCSAPCANLITKQEYKTLVDGIRKLLTGELDELIEDFKTRMAQASEKLDFERAAFYRDRIKDLERTTLKQVIVLSARISKDIMAVAKKGDDACIQLLMIRSGKLIDQAHYFLEGAGGSSDEEILSAFMTQHYQYGASSSIPQEIMVSRNLEDKELLQRSLSERRKGLSESMAANLVHIATPVNDEDLKLIEMAEQNADAYLEQNLAQEDRRKLRAEQALVELKTMLRLPNLPIRIEAFDVSTAGGDAAVGSMVVMLNGEPAKSMYRRFKIKGVQGQDDFAMIREIVKRRYKRLTEKKEKNVTTLPELVLVDGGKGQLNAALEAERELDISMPTIGLAKEFEDVYVQHQPNPVDMPKDSKAMLLLKRARDEAHRFAVAYHRKRMARKTLESILDTVPGIGSKRKAALFRYFKSLEDISTADEARISKALRISKVAARKLIEQVSDMRRGQ
ncbi:MAG: excinuclease ABC subunit UvrC [Candidatus Atabeyarchaeum deiterrae]